MGITATAKVGSISTPSIINSSIFLSDSFGNKLESFSVNDQLQIVGTIINEQNFKQQFVYIFQVKDAHDTVVSVSWISGEISPNQNLDVSQSWIPAVSGSHFVETFVWKSFADPIPLSAPEHVEITIQ